MESNENTGKKLAGLTPREIVEKLDMYIIGQNKAKKAVAVALRNRERRMMLRDDIKDEVAPKNILMIGPTGSGKTEIARRLAKLLKAPFLKVEATKYTEVGYVGRDVESMIRDLMAVGFKEVKHEYEENLRNSCAPKVEERLLDLLLPGSGEKAKKAKKSGDETKKIASDPVVVAGSSSDPQSQMASFFQGIFSSAQKASEEEAEKIEKDAAETAENLKDTREKFRQMLREGKLEDREVEMNVKRSNHMPTMEIIAGGSMDDLQGSMQELSQLLSGRGTKTKMVTVREARKLLTEEVLDSMIDPDKVSEEAKNRVENRGIIFIDEIDKIAVRGEASGQSVSREGVQRDILPIVEGSNVNTKFGVIDTTHILFIAAGAFSVAAPSDLIPELQGRFPLRVELESLSKEDFKRILTEPKNSLTKQYTALLETEGLNVVFEDSAIERMCEIAETVNKTAENIGARRLHTIMEKVLEDVSFDANEHSGETINITVDFVNDKLQDVNQNQDLGRYIL